MEPRVVNTIICLRCLIDLSPAVERCPRCGESTSAIESEAATDGPKQSLLDRPLFMLGFLFLASLFLGLPYLWKGRAFGGAAKVVISVLVLVETVFLFWGFVLVMKWSWGRIAG